MQMEMIKSLIGKKTRLLLLAECLLLLAGVLVAVFAESGTVYFFKNMDDAVREELTLKRGTYTLNVPFEYEGDSNNPGALNIETVDGEYYSVLENSVPLFKGMDEAQLKFIVKSGSAKIRIVPEFEDSVYVSFVEIIKTRNSYYMDLSALLLIFLLVDILVFIRNYDEKYGLGGTAQIVLIAIPTAALLSSFPSFVDYNIMGPDLSYHLLRIEALADNIINGDILQRNSARFLAGHGYASSFFYGDTLLLFPAILRVIGFTPDTAYRAFIFFVNILTAVVSYISFKGISRDTHIGIAGSILYTLSPYRVYNCYNRSAVGEFAAMTFFPLIVYGLYRIYTLDKNETSYKWSFLIPALGFSGIIQSHMLSCEMAGFFTALVCLILWKRTFSKGIFRQLFLTVAGTVLVNLWYIVPCLDLLLSDEYKLSGNANMLIQSRGVYLYQFFYTHQAAGSSSSYPDYAFMDAEPIDMGFALLLGVVLLIIFLSKKYEKSSLCHTGIICLSMLGLSAFMSSSLFPWNALSNIGLKAFVGPIQFPTRLTGIVTVLAVMCTCVFLMLYKNKTILYVLCGLSVIFGIYHTNDIALKNHPFKLYNGEGMGSTGVLGAEYLPVDAEIEHMSFHEPYFSDGIAYDNYSKDGLSVTMHIDAAEDGYVLLPMLYYKGYFAWDANSGDKLAISPGENYDVRVNFDKGYSGNVEVKYTGMGYWHIAMYVSIVSAMAILAVYIFDSKIRLKGKTI